VSESDFTERDHILQIGVAPCRIDLMTSIDGVAFPEAWEQRVSVYLDGVPVQILSREHLIRNKREVGRPQDTADLAWLERDTGASNRDA
jgi:predicted nucleotidyltransferase